MIKNNKVYDALKYLAQILLPAAGTFYFSLSGIWNLPNANKVVGTVVVIDTFLGVLLHLSSTAYENSGAKYAGSIDVDNTDAKKTFSLNLHGDPDEIENQKDITFKVNTVQSLPVAKTTKKSVSPKNSTDRS